MNRPDRQIVACGGLFAVVAALGRSRTAVRDGRRKTAPRTQPVPARRSTAASAERHALVDVRLLGTIEIVVRGETVRTCMRHGRELLAYLLIHPDGDTMSNIVADLWPELSCRSAVDRFANAVKNLRFCLRTASGMTDFDFVTWDGHCYRIERRYFDADVWRFTAALAAARSANSRAAEIAALDVAVAAYGGHLLPGHAYEWVPPHRLALEQQAVAASVRLRELHRRAGDGARVPLRDEFASVRRPTSSRDTAKAVRRRGVDRERGSMSLFAAILTPAYLALLGLVVDGGYTIAARARATSHAQNAARAGANALDETDLRAGLLRIDPANATEATDSYLERTGNIGEVTASPDEVTVVVTIRQPMTVLSLFNIGTLTVHGEASAEPVRATGTGP